MGIIPGPSVVPQYYGGDVGGRIADAFMTNYQLDRQKQLDALQYGIGLQWPGTSQGQPAQGPSIGVGDRIRAALSHVGIGSNPIPAEQAQWRLNQGTPSVGVTANAAQGQPGLSAAPAPDVGGIGGLPDYMQLPNGQRIPTIMTPFGSRILAAMKTRADIGLAGTEADKNAADAEYTRHKNVQPLPGDANYVQTMQPIWGGQAGAEAAAKYPYQLGVVGAQNQGRLDAARISAGATLGAANIGAQSRTTVANIEQGGANLRQAAQQQFERGMVVPKAQAGAAAAQSTQAFKERGEFIPSVVRPARDFLSWAHDELLGPGSAPKRRRAPLPGARPTITGAERAALIKQGFAPADVDAKYVTQGGSPAPLPGRSF